MVDLAHPPSSRWDAATRAMGRVRDGALRGWRSPAALLLALALVHIVIIRRAFAAGALADIDSICHVSYLQYLRDEFHPNTGAFFGFTPKYNLGAPFLLYNVPPGVSLAAWPLVLIGVSPAAAIKALLIGSYLSLPSIAFFLARAAAPSMRSFPQLAAIFIALYSSDVFGLEFFLHFGMVNACLAIPLMGLTLLALLHAIDARSSRGRLVFALAAASVGFASVLLTHILSGYFLTLGIGALVVGGRLRGIGRSAVLAAAVVAVGGLLAAFWLLPSADFAPKEETFYNWMRNPGTTVRQFLDGSLEGSFLGGFSDDYRSKSYVGIATVGLGALGVVEAFRRKAPGVRAIAVFFLLCGLITLGPVPSFGLGWLPGYTRLLWLRFVTPALFAWFLLTAYGAASLHELLATRGWSRRLVTAALAVTILVGGRELVDRGDKIRVVGDYPEFMADYQTVVTWVREHGDRRGRVFGEFLALSPEPVPSVNYVRQMLAIDTGLAEVGGWVYENSPASTELAARGAFWWSPHLMTGDAERLALKYVVAGSPHARRAFQEDARWQLVVDTPRLALYEARDFVPRLAICGTRAVENFTQEYVEGGGYRYRWTVAPSRDAAAGESCVLRVNASSAWSVLVDGALTPIRETPDRFIEVSVGDGPSTIECSFKPRERIRGGRWISALAALALVAAVVIGRKRRVPMLDSAWLEWAGRVFGVLALAIVLWLGRKNDFSRLHFGAAHGIETDPSRDPRRAELGTIREIEEGAAVRLKDGAWSVPTLSPRGPGRSPIDAAPTHARIRMAAGASLLVTGSPSGAPIELVLYGADHTEACRMRGAEGVPVDVSETCRLVGTPTEGPGRALDLAVHSAVALHVVSISVRDRSLVVQAESMHNVFDDSGFEALVVVSHPRTFPENGFAAAPMDPTNDRASSVALERTLALPPGRWDAWALLTVAPRAHDDLRARFALRFGDRDVGAFDGVADDVTGAMIADATYFRWVRLGVLEGGARSTLRLSFEKKNGAHGTFGEVDALAFTPSDDTP